ncbi:MAG: ABC transporter permease [Chlamydiae bacterium]|nr:ABC transporter permease [Chlamydiota bacterium]
MGKKLKGLIPHAFLFVTFGFLYLPLLVLVAFSFNSRSFPSPWGNFTLKWYKELFSSSGVWESFFNSFIVASTSTLLCTMLTMFLLYLLLRYRTLGNWSTLFYGNLIIPETVLGVGLLSYFSLLNIPLGIPTIIIAHTVLGLGFSIPILFTRFFEIDHRIFEASRVLGASSTQTFFKVALPLIRPTFFATGLMIFIISFDDFVLTYFCSGTSAQTLSLFLVASIRFGVSPVINAFASILLILIILLASLFFSFKKEARLF